MQTKAALVLAPALLAAVLANLSQAREQIEKRTWNQLARSLRVHVLVPGAIAQADAIFQTGKAPWCPEIF